LDGQLHAQKLSARSADRVLGLSWTVADLRGRDVPDEEDVELALALRRDTPLGPGLRELVA
jgi:magnesium chelatase family protein